MSAAHNIVLALAALCVLLVETDAAGERRDAPDAAGDCYTECCGDCKVKLVCAVNSDGLNATTSECTDVETGGLGDYCCKEVQPASPTTEKPTRAGGSGGKKDGATKAPALTSKAPPRSTAGSQNGNENNGKSGGGSSGSAADGGQSASSSGGSGKSAPTMAPTTSATSATSAASSRTSSSAVANSTESPEPTIETDDGGSACLHVDLLREYDHTHLVHREHFVTKVLCLSNWNGGDGITENACATQHHKVIYKGRSLSMAQLCAQGDPHGPNCYETNAPVNNALSNIHGQEVLKIGDVTFTHYDSRYPEWAQRLLHRIVSARLF